MRKFIACALIVTCFTWLEGCTTLQPVPLTRAPPDIPGPRKIAVFFDGTSNDPNQRFGTNVLELYKVVREFEKAGLFYIEGVGAKGKPIGMAMAWGIGMRVRAAYAYLLDHYRAGDEIYLFGFSRGAYSARILASVLYHAGLSSTRINGVSSGELADVIYDAFKGDMTGAERIHRVELALTRRRLAPLQPVSVKFMGLWDTVEALGWPDYEENVDVPNPRYGDQLCNVERAVHAVSFDDNRARIFTPILLTRNHLLDNCARDAGPAPTRTEVAQRINAKVREVYFAGAHADVGGGYDDGEGKLSGVSLNWMTRRAKEFGLLAELDASTLAASRISFNEDPFAKGHDPESAFPYNLIYKRMYRSIDGYADHADSTTPIVRFHISLKERIEKFPRTAAEYGGTDKEAQALLKSVGARGRFATCFGAYDGVHKYVPSDRCQISIEND